MNHDQQEYFHFTSKSRILKSLNTLTGILADDVITEGELQGLQDWLEDHDHLRTTWPYDEIDSLIIGVMQDQRIDAEEQALLQRVFAEFVQFDDDCTITNPSVEVGGEVSGLCAACPELDFPDRHFCFTGGSAKVKRGEIESLVTTLGGKFQKNPTKQTDFLIIGADGNPCWAYACYGRKVEKAVHLRKQGSRLLIVHENDFWDAVVDRE